MSWFSGISDWFTGYDAENARRAEAADAELRALLQKQQAAGYYTPQQWSQIEKDYASQSTIGEAGQRDEIGEAFSEGLAEGRQNITGFVRGVFDQVGKALGSVLLGVPFWVWLLVAGAVLWKLGGLGWLERRVKGALSR